MYHSDDECRHALEMATSVASADPANLGARLICAWCLIELLQYREALRHLVQARDLLLGGSEVPRFLGAGTTESPDPDLRLVCLQALDAIANLRLVDRLRRGALDSAALEWARLALEHDPKSGSDILAQPGLDSIHEQLERMCNEAEAAAETGGAS